MKTGSVSAADLYGVFAVPPLARAPDARRAIDLEQNDRLVRHIAAGGITRFIYGGNALLYHVTLAEYERLIEWLSCFEDGLWAIPSVGPSYGRAVDQAKLLRNYRFPCVMMLPGSDPRDAAGLERGYREIAEASGTPLIVYLKDEDNFGSDKEAGLAAVARLIDDGICVGIKYAVVRQDPAQDSYLEALLDRVGRQFVISGIGERPAVVHMRDWGLPGFTTGSGCIAPRLSQMLLEACTRNDFQVGEALRKAFIPLEDLRDEWGPARVLHFATDLAGLAATGPVPPYLSELSAKQQDRLRPIACELTQFNTRAQLESSRSQAAF